MTKRNLASKKSLSAMDAEETLHAIRNGAVDAFVVEEFDGHRVYTLEGADLPYSSLVERMQQGAAMLNPQGDIVYCNLSLTQLLGKPREAIIGTPLQQFVSMADQSRCMQLLRQTQMGASGDEMRLRRVDGTLIPADFSFTLLSREQSAIGVLITDLTAQKQQVELTSRLQRTQDDERRRIARDLHDSVGQLLAAILMNMSKVKDEAHKLSPEGAKLMNDSNVMVNQISDEIRTISHLLHPPLLDEVGLPSAVQWYIDGFAERSKIQTTLEIAKNFDRLPQDMEIALFRMVQESLTNVHRHSGSPSCTVKITADERQLRVEIRDLGCGIPKAKLSTLTSSGGVGFRGMWERIRQLGGTLDVESNESGTIVSATLPIPSARDISDEGVA